MRKALRLAKQQIESEPRGAANPTVSR